ncbi:magnesium transporter, partial [Pseudomonas syringae pv. pisi]
MRDYDFMAVPVIDYQEHLLGIITIDDILDVMDEEASEDYSRLAGVSDIDSTNDSIIKTALKRLPWLIILTFLGMLIISATENGKLTFLQVFFEVMSAFGTCGLSLGVTSDISDISKVVLMVLMFI